MTSGIGGGREEIASKNFYFRGRATEDERNEVGPTGPRIEWTGIFQARKTAKEVNGNAGIKKSPKNNRMFEGLRYGKKGRRDARKTRNLILKRTKPKLASPRGMS